MKSCLSLLVLLLATVSAFAANPTFRSFDTNVFTINEPGNKISANTNSSNPLALVNQAQLLAAGGVSNGITATTATNIVVAMNALTNNDARNPTINSALTVNGLLTANTNLLPFRLQTSTDREFWRLDYGPGYGSFLFGGGIGNGLILSEGVDGQATTNVQFAISDGGPVIMPWGLIVQTNAVSQDDFGNAMTNAILAEGDLYVVGNIHSNLVGTVQTTTGATIINSSGNVSAPDVSGVTIEVTSATANTLAKYGPTKSFVSIANPVGSSGITVLTNDSSGNFGWALLINATAVTSNSMVLSDVNSNLTSAANSFGVATNNGSGAIGFNSKPILDLGASTNANVWDSRTNDFTGNTFWLGTNMSIITSSDVDLNAIGNAPGLGIERYGQLTIVATANINLTNPPSWKANDMVTTRVITNGNTAVIALDYQINHHTNFFVVQCH